MQDKIIDHMILNNDKGRINPPLVVLLILLMGSMNLTPTCIFSLITHYLLLITVFLYSILDTDLFFGNSKSLVWVYHARIFNYISICFQNSNPLFACTIKSFSNFPERVSLLYLIIIWYTLFYCLC